MTCLIGSPNDTHTSWDLLGRQEVTAVTECLKNSNDSGLLFTSFSRSCHSFPHDRMELHIEEKQWEITFSDLRKQHDLTGRNPSLVCQDKLYPWECIATHLHAKKQTQTSDEPVIIINGGMKGNRVGLGQGSGRDQVSGGGNFSRDPVYTWYYTRLCAGMGIYFVLTVW